MQIGTHNVWAWYNQCSSNGHFCLQKRKVEGGSNSTADSAPPVPISPTTRFKQPLSSPSALYPDFPPGVSDSMPLSPTASLGGFPSSTGLFGRTISAGTYVCMCCWSPCRPAYRSQIKLVATIKVLWTLLLYFSKVCISAVFAELGLPITKPLLIKYRPSSWGSSKSRYTQKG